MGTDKIVFTPVLVPRNGARVLPLEVVPVPGAQIFARTPTKSSAQTGARARAQCPDFCSASDKKLCSD